MGAVVNVGRWGLIQSGTSELIVHIPSSPAPPTQHQTAAHFGVRVTQEDISLEKAKGNANNDWVGFGG